VHVKYLELVPHVSTYSISRDRCFTEDCRFKPVVITDNINTSGEEVI